MYIHEKNVHNTQAASEVVPLIIERFKPKAFLTWAVALVPGYQYLKKMV